MSENTILSNEGASPKPKTTDDLLVEAVRELAAEVAMLREDLRKGLGGIDNRIEEIGGPSW